MSLDGQVAVTAAPVRPWPRNACPGFHLSHRPQPGNHELPQQARLLVTSQKPPWPWRARVRPFPASECQRHHVATGLSDTPSMMTQRPSDNVTQLISPVASGVQLPCSEHLPQGLCTDTWCPFLLSWVLSDIAANCCHCFFLKVLSASLHLCDVILTYFFRTYLLAHLQRGELFQLYIVSFPKTPLSCLRVAVSWKTVPDQVFIIAVGCLTPFLRPA